MAGNKNHSRLPTGTEVELEIASTMEGRDVKSVKLIRKSAKMLPENEMKDIVPSDRDKNACKEITAVNDSNQTSMPEKHTESVVQNMPSKEVGGGRAQQLPAGVTRQDLKALQLEFQNELKHLQKQLLSKLDGIQSEVKRPDENGSKVDKRLGLIESAMQSQGQVTLAPFRQAFLIRAPAKQIFGSGRQTCRVCKLQLWRSILTLKISACPQAIKSLKGMEAQVEELMKEKMERESNKGCCTIS